MSDLLVLKFGGTSVATAARVRLAARRIAAHVRRGRRVVVVVSAAGHDTDRILARVDAVRGSHVDIGAGREVDRALATGEDRSAALLATALWQLGVPARSLRGGEAGIRGAGPFGCGRIEEVVPGPLRQLTSRDVVPVVSGFQAARRDGETITLGRGGSDTSAVAVAAALAAPCHIVTDVSAVHDRDPRTHPDAQPLRHVTHHQLLRLVEGGAQVVHPAAARLALDAGVPLHVYHFRAPLHGAGTVVGPARLPSAAGAGGVA